MYQPRSEKLNKTEIPDFNSLGWEIYLGNLFGRLNCPIVSMHIYGTGLSVLDLILGFV